MDFAKLASEAEVMKSNPAVLGSGSKAPLLMVAAREHELYDDLDEKDKAQVLPALLPFQDTNNL
ncbi:hypothetical protein C0995_011762 [Termitomyces sp. Mi166|nr:hypothetical protein C0995_011762 [Termitomyces sp. Mi166\